MNYWLNNEPKITNDYKHPTITHAFSRFVNSCNGFVKSKTRIKILTTGGYIYEDTISIKESFSLSK